MTWRAARTIVVGDVHGCLEELDELLATLQVRAGVDRLIFAGDLVDRGPDPVGVVRRVRELGAPCVRGNHEEKHLRWARHEAKRRADATHKNPMRMSEDRQAQHAALGEASLAWLAALPLTIPLDDAEPGVPWVVVHAGFEPGRPVAKQHERIVVRVRFLDEAGRMLGIRGAGDEPPNAIRWATRWTGPESVIYGHAVLGMEAPRRDEPKPGVTCMGIDTGCCFGGRLTAFVLPGREIVQVAAQRAYAKFAIED